MHCSKRGVGSADSGGDHSQRSRVFFVELCTIPPPVSLALRTPGISFQAIEVMEDKKSGGFLGGLGGVQLRKTTVAHDASAPKIKGS